MDRPRPISSLKRCKSSSQTGNPRCSILALLVIGTVISTTTSNSSDPATGTELDGVHFVGTGWKNIDLYWPRFHRGGLFLANEQGHNYIRIKLPQELSNDLQVKLRYFFNYKRVKPLIQIVPCNNNVEIEQKIYVEPGPTPLIWNDHKMRINLQDCLRRNELAYNVLLHDEGDVFAWERVEVSTIVPEETVTTTGPVIDTNDPSPSGSSGDTSSSEAGKPAIQPAPSGETSPSETDKHATQISASEGISKQKPVEQSTQNGSAEEKSEPNSSKGKVVKNADSTIGSNDSPTPQKSVDLAVNDDKPDPKPNIDSISDTKDPTNSEKSDKKAKSKSRGLGKTKRDTSGQSFEASCSPNFCDRRIFTISRFITLHKGFPPVLPMDGFSQNYITTDRKKELRLVTKSSRDTFFNKDMCLRFDAFMEPGSQLDLELLDRCGSQEHSKLLETIQPQTLADPSEPRWERYERCVTNYMPSLELADGLGSGDGQLGFKFIPRNLPAGQSIVINVNSFIGITKRPAPYPLEFLSNAVNDPQLIKKQWILDRDGRNGHHDAKVERVISEESTSRDPPKPHLLISNIEPNQEHFDITSRWLRIADAETLEFPLFFNYRPDTPSWVDSIYYDFQKAGEPWRTHKIYDRASETVAPLSQADSSTIAQPRVGLIHPIKIKGLKSEDFRMRIRHTIGNEARRAARPLSFKVHTLSFGDICAETSFCKNSAECKPLGASKAECRCQRGFHGRFCEQIKPCDVLYNGVTGIEWCQSVGATCVESIPVFRCSWPDTEWFTSWVKPGGNLPPGNANDNTSGNGAGDSPDVPIHEQVIQLKERNVEQEKLIIILGVFMAALVLFGTVLLFSMVGRLMKSKKRLRRTEGEMLEMSRNIPIAGSSRIGSFTRMGAAGGVDGPPVISGPILSQGAKPNRAPAILSYNNNAFDQ